MEASLPWTLRSRCVNFEHLLSLLPSNILLLPSYLFFRLPPPSSSRNSPEMLRHLSPLPLARLFTHLLPVSQLLHTLCIERDLYTSLSVPLPGISVPVALLLPHTHPYPRADAYMHAHTHSHHSPSLPPTQRPTARDRVQGGPRVAGERPRARVHRRGAVCVCVCACACAVSALRVRLDLICPPPPPVFAFLIFPHTRR